jgi:hypothetical protein
MEDIKQLRVQVLSSIYSPPVVSEQHKSIARIEGGGLMLDYK